MTDRQTPATAARIRPATVADADGIARVHVDTWRDAYAGIIPDEVLAALDVDARAQRLRELLAGPDPFTTHVATRAGEVVGFVTFGPYRRQTPGADPRTDLDPRVGEILAIYVHPAHQGAGVGRALMDAAVTELTGRGMTEVRLWVLAENGPSRRFYERYGLAPDGVCDTFQVRRADGTAVDLPEVRYARRLAAT